MNDWGKIQMLSEEEKDRAVSMILDVAMPQRSNIWRDLYRTANAVGLRTFEWRQTWRISFRTIMALRMLVLGAVSVAFFALFLYGGSSLLCQRLWGMRAALLVPSAWILVNMVPLLWGLPQSGADCGKWKCCGHGTGAAALADYERHKLL